VPVRSHFRGFARPRYQSRRATSSSPGLRRGCKSSVAIDVHGSLDRVKDVSSVQGELVRPHLKECVRLAHADDVPLLILPEDTCCRRCVRGPGKRPLPTRRTDQDSRCSVRPRRLTASCEPGCLSPLRPERLGLGGSLLLATRHPHRLSAHAAHTFSPWLGTMCFGGHCKRPLGCYAEETSESSAPLQPRGIRTGRMTLSSPRLGLTTQASERGSVCVAVREG
jgi:hypothetical protein